MEQKEEAIKKDKAERNRIDPDVVLDEMGHVPKVALGARVFGLGEADRINTAKATSLDREAARRTWKKEKPSGGAVRPVDATRRKIDQFRNEIAREKQESQIPWKQRKEDAFTLHGRVVDEKKLGKTNTSVRLMRGKEVVATATTDHKGYFDFTYEPVEKEELTLEIVDDKGTVLHRDEKAFTARTGGLISRNIRLKEAKPKTIKWSMTFHRGKVT